jgi:hypothetical protein
MYGDRIDAPEGAGVIYMKVGYKHFPFLTVSLMSLRDVYKGPVAILAGGDDAQNFIEKYILPDKRLHPLYIVPFDFKSYGRGSVYYAKTSMGDMSPFNKTVFLDCDTLVCGDFSELWPKKEEEVRLTQFARWNTKTRRIYNRIEGWRDVLPKHVDFQQKTAHPAINTGVMGFSKSSSAFMDMWKQTTIKNIRFICDEVCCQLIYTDFPNHVLDDRYNASPMYSWKWRKPGSEEEAIIWHGHGKKFLKNSQEVQEAIWLPYFKRALSDNIGDIRSWVRGRGFKGLLRVEKYLSRAQRKEYLEGIAK